MVSSFLYDVFISHSSKDKVTVRKLAERLKSDGLRVWLDEWEIKPGDMIGLKINKGIEQSRVLILAISGNASESDWVTFESQTIFFNDLTNQQRRFIPLLLDNSEIKPGIRQFAYIDWRNASSEQYFKLLAACSPSASKNILKEEITNLQGKTIKAHARTILGISMTPDGNKVVTASRDKTVKVWDIENEKCLAILNGHIDGVWSTALSADGKIIVSGSRDQSVKVWDTTTEKCLNTFKVTGQKAGIWCVSVTPDGKKVISGSHDGKVRFWDLNGGKLLSTLIGHTDFVVSICLSKNGKMASPVWVTKPSEFGI